MSFRFDIASVRIREGKSVPKKVHVFLFGSKKYIYSHFDQIDGVSTNYGTIFSC